MTDRPFDPRDLIPHLPELLAGSEPLLDAPQAKRILREDPAAQAALLAVADYVQVFTGARPTRFRRVLPSAEKPIEEAAKRLAEPLRATLLAEGRRLFLAASADSRWCDGPPMPKALQSSKTLATLPPVLGLEPSEWRRYLSLVAQDDVDGLAGLRRADALFRAAIELGGERSIAEYYCMLIRSVETQSVSKDDWESLARRTTVMEIRGACLFQLGQLLALRKPDDAVSVDEQAATLLPAYAVGTYNTMLHAGMAADSRTALAATTDLAARLAAFPGLDVLVSAQVDRDRGFWRSVSSRSRAIVEHLTATLPEHVASAIIGALENED